MKKLKIGDLINLAEFQAKNKNMVYMTLKIPNVIIYTKSGCSSCTRLKKLLNENNTEFREINDEIEENYLEMTRISGQEEKIGEALIPATLIWNKKWQGRCFIGIKKTEQAIKDILNI